MIKNISDVDLVSVKQLHTDYYGRKILSYYIAYGTRHDFCRFFEIYDDGNKGYIVQFNAEMIIFSPSDVPLEELRDFIIMNKPFRVEAPCNIMGNISDICGYKMLRRTKFEFTDHKPDNFDLSRLDINPKLDDIYEILHEGFPSLVEYQLWMTENSHKIRRGLSKIYLYNNCTTATVIYDVDDHVLIGQVATKKEARGKGYARELLYWIGHSLSLEGKTVKLFALDYRESFYKEIGFKAVSAENVIQVE